VELAGVELHLCQRNGLCACHDEPFM
jgi:hypothetical protein